MKRYLSLFPMYVVSTFVVGTLSLLLMTIQAKALSDVVDTLGTNNPGVLSDHAITFSTTTLDAPVISFTGFTGTPVLADWTASAPGGVPTLTKDAGLTGSGPQSIVVTGLTNPVYASIYSVNVNADTNTDLAGSVYIVTDLLSTQAASAAATHTVAFTTTGTTASITFPADFTGAITGVTGATCDYVTDDHIVDCTGLDVGPHSLVVAGLSNPVAGVYSIITDIDGETISTNVFVGLGIWTRNNSPLNTRLVSVVQNYYVEFTTGATSAIITVDPAFTGTATTDSPNCAVTAPDWATSHSITCTGITPGYQGININSLTNPSTPGNYPFTIYTGSDSAFVNISIGLVSHEYSSNGLLAYSSHTVTYELNTAPVAGDIFIIDFAISGYGDENYDCTGLINSDVTITGWTVNVVHETASDCHIELTAVGSPDNTLVMFVSATHMRNSGFLGGISLQGSREQTTPLYLELQHRGGSEIGTDVLSNSNASKNSSHTVTYNFLINQINGNTFTIDFPAEFDCTGLVEGDISLSANWSFTSVDAANCVVVATAGDNSSNPIVVTIASTHMVNPVTVGKYDVALNYGYYAGATWDGGNWVGGTWEYRDLNVSINIIVGSSDVMSRVKVDVNSTHTISNSFIQDPLEGETFTIDFASGFDCTGLDYLTDVTVSSGWTATSSDDASCVVVVTAGLTPSNPVVVSIANTNMKNPATAGSYMIYLSGSGESLSLQVAIVDSDEVLVNGYIATSLTFDLDTNTDGGECSASGGEACLIHTGGAAGSNYTVDLGNLTYGAVNKSAIINVMHSDNNMGYINSIYFNLGTNAASGAVVTYKSLYGELRGPGHNVDAAIDLDIPTVVDGSTPIVERTSAYGIQLVDTNVTHTRVIGTETVNCGSSLGTYCVMGIINATTGVNEQTALPIYSVTGPIEGGRGQIDVAAAIDGTNLPGTYRDYVTFVATSTF